MKKYKLVLIMLGFVLGSSVLMNSFVSANEEVEPSVIEASSQEESLDEWMPDAELQKQIEAMLSVPREEITKEKMLELRQIGTRGLFPYNADGYAYYYTPVTNWKGIEYATNVDTFIFTQMDIEEMHRAALPTSIINQIKMVTWGSGNADRQGFHTFVKEQFPNVEDVSPFPGNYVSYSKEKRLDANNYKQFTLTLEDFVTLVEDSNSEVQVNINSYTYDMIVGDFTLHYQIEEVDGAYLFTLQDDIEYAQVEGSRNTLPKSDAWIESFIHISQTSSWEHTPELTYTFYNQPVLRFAFDSLKSLVEVDYIDTLGNSIQESTVHEYDYEGAYALETPSIDGYVFVEASQELIGSVRGQKMKIELTYEKEKEQALEEVVVNAKDDNNVVASTTVNHKLSSVATGDEVNQTMFYMFGVMMLSVGLLVLIGKKT